MKTHRFPVHRRPDPVEPGMAFCPPRSVGEVLVSYDEVDFPDVFAALEHVCRKFLGDGEFDGYEAVCRYFYEEYREKGYSECLSAYYADIKAEKLGFRPKGVTA